MIRAEFNFNEKGIKAKGYFSCLVTDFEEMSFIPVECYIQELFFKCKGFPDLEKLKNKCWENAVALIF